MEDGNLRFNLSAFFAIGEVTKQIYKENQDFVPIRPMDYGRFLVISLGRGSSKFEEKYNSQKAKSWGALDWLLSSGSTPLVDKPYGLNFNPILSPEINHENKKDLTLSKINPSQ